MARFTFKSLAEPNRRYVVSTERLHDDWRNDNQHMGNRVAWFETYGDGDTQHCPFSKVMATEMFTDFCASAAEYLLSVTTDGDDMARTLHNEMTEHGLHAAKVRGAAAVEYKEGKRRYVSTSDDFKVSSAESKRYDKRWDEVVQWMNGSFASVVGLLHIGRSSFLCMWNSLVEVARTYEDVTGNNSQNPWQYLDWLHWNWQTGGRAEEAFKALKLACKATIDRDNARRVLECYHSNVENDRRLAAEESARKQAAQTTAAA